MQQDRMGKALALISMMMNWENDGSLTWDTGVATLSTDQLDGDIVWSVEPKAGGPIRISHKTHDLQTADIAELADAAAQLISIGRDVELYSHERVGFENDMKRTAKSLLRRKAAAGIRLVGVVSQTIPTDDYQYIGLEVTFAWGPVDSEQQATLKVDSDDDLKEQFEDLCEQLDEASWRRAA